MRTLTFMTIVVLFSSFRFPSIETTVYGHLRSRAHKMSVSNATVFVRAYGQTLASGKTDSRGKFRLFFNVSSSIDSPICFYYAHQGDTLLLKKVYRFKESEEVKGEDQAYKLSFYIP